MTTLHLQLLGTFHLCTEHEQPLDLLARKAEALVAYLAVEHQQAHSRDNLVGLLWPNAPTDKARLSLRVALSRLKSVVEGVDARSPFHADRHDVQFVKDGCWFDVTAFTQALRSVEGHGHRADELCAQCAPAVAHAVSLYRGTFLDGIYLDDCQVFDEWLFVQRERFRIQVLGALGKLVAYHMRQGQPEQSLIYARRQLEIDPLHEEAHLASMRAYLAQGRRIDALRQYELCRAALLAELGVEPTQETRQLFEQIHSSAKPTNAAPSAVPAGVTTQRPPSRLPSYFTPFIGRQDELDLFDAALRSVHSRLISLVGAGGMGKTRLAVEVAAQWRDHFADGVYFVPLASVQNPEAVVDTLAAAFGVTFRVGERTPQMQLLDWLHPRVALLVLDNMEHLPASVPFLLEILHAAPGVQLLVTSREPLGTQAEDLIRLAGLSVPDDDDVDTVSRSPAARLFVERAYRVNKRFHLSQENAADVARICRLVEGRPLALELAATHTAYRSCAAIADAIRADLDFLAVELVDLPARHRSLRAVFEESWRMLTPGEQSCFARLSLFRNPFGVDAAIAVAGASLPVLTRLLTAHLIQRHDDEHFQIHELLRQFATQKLAHSLPNPSSLQRRHAEYFLTWLKRQDQILNGIQPRQYVEAIQSVLDDVDAGWGWASATGAVDLLARALPVLAAFYALRGMHNTAERLCHATLAQISEEDKALRAQLLVRLGFVLERQGKVEASIRALEEGVALAEQINDLGGWAFGKLSRARLDSTIGSVSAAANMLKAVLARLPDDELLVLRTDILILLGTLQSELGDYNFVSSYQEARRIITHTGNRVQEQRLLLYHGLDILEENEVAGRQAFEQALALCPDTGDRTLETRILNALGFSLARVGRYQDAIHHQLNGLAICTADQEAIQQSHALHNLCVNYYGLGDYAQAYLYGIEALKIAEANDLVEAIGYAQLHLGHVLAEMRRFDEATHALTAAKDAFGKLDRLNHVVEADAGLGYVACLRGDLSTALVHAESVYAYLLPALIPGMDEPTRVYLHCHQVFAAVNDPRGQDLLAAAFHFIQTRAALLDPADRASLLNAVPANRAILAAWGGGA